MKIAINGLGRIGKLVLQGLLSKNDKELDVIAVNIPRNLDSIVHLLNYDSVHKQKFDFEFKVKGKGKEQKLLAGKKEILILQEMNPEKLPWKELEVELVIESTGKFRTKKEIQMHLKAGAKKVLLTAPGKQMDVTLLLGVNEKKYDSKKHNIISAASCTTNSLAPLCKVLHEKFKIEKGLMTTIHSYTSDQRLLDGSHKDLRRARAAANNIIPTTTGAAKMIGEIMPELKGKIDGIAVRIPTPNVSLTDLTIQVKKNTSIEEVNNALKEAAENELKGILFFSDKELVSSDYIGSEYSSIVDSLLTNVIGENLVKVFAWYDNEYGYTQRVIDLSKLIQEKGF